MAELPSIGFVGLGNMGSVMVRRLAEAGFPVTGFDLAAHRLAALRSVRGVRLADSAAEVATGTQAVILMLPDSDAVETVLLRDGVLAAAGPGTVIVDMSSSQPDRTRTLAERIAKTGAFFLDAPVSGGVGGAEKGTLTIMVGGEADLMERMRPAFEVLGSRVMHAGTVGSGHAIKALNNLLSATHLLASVETLEAARRFGIEPARFVEVINGSTGRNASTENKLPAFVLPERYESGFALQLMVKDMRIALAIEQSTSTTAEVSRAALRTWERAAAALPAHADHTEIARWVTSQPDAERRSHDT